MQVGVPTSLLARDASTKAGRRWWAQHRVSTLARGRVPDPPVGRNRVTGTPAAESAIRVWDRPAACDHCRQCDLNSSAQGIQIQILSLCEWWVECKRLGGRLAISASLHPHPTLSNSTWMACAMTCALPRSETTPSTVWLGRRGEGMLRVGLGGCARGEGGEGGEGARACGGSTRQASG